MSSSAPTHPSDPKLLVISEEDVLQAVGSGAGSQQGLTAQDVEVHFQDGKMVLKAGYLAYSMVRVKNLTMVARLIARDGKLDLETESISPRGLGTAMIPTFAKHALNQFTSKWYVEAVEIVDGQLRLHIR